MYYVYVLKSYSTGRLYIGMTATIDDRLKSHNAGKARSTKAYRPWRIIHTEAYKEKRTALQRERQLKTSGIARRRLKEASL